MEKQKRDWKTIEDDIRNHPGVYSKADITRKYQLRKFECQVHFRYRLEFEDLFRNGYEKYDWKTVEEDIRQNPGVYSRMDICKKYNICRTAAISHFKKNKEFKPLLCVKNRKDLRYDWQSIEQDVRDNPNKYSFAIITKKYGMTFSACINHFKRCPELKELILDDSTFRKYNWKIIEDDIKSCPRGEYSITDICKKYGTTITACLSRFRKSKMMSYLRPGNWKYNWIPVYEDIKQNPGKYTTDMISKKYDIPKVVVQSMLGNHPELKSLVISLKANVDWEIIEEDIRNHPGEYTQADIIRKYDLHDFSVVSRHFKRHPESKEFLRDGSGQGRPKLVNVPETRRRFSVSEQRCRMIKEFLTLHSKEYTKKEVLKILNITDIPLRNFLKLFPEYEVCLKASEDNRGRGRKLDWKRIDEKIVPIIEKLTVDNICKHFSICKSSVRAHLKELGLLNKIGTNIPNPLDPQYD